MLTNLNKNLFLTVSILTVIFACFGHSTAQSVTAREKKDLFQLISTNDERVVNAIRDDGVAAGKLAKEISVKKMDLNRDGRAEYLVVLDDLVLCGAHANCPNWVYGKTGSEYTLLLATAGQTLTLEKTSTGKYRDLRSSGSDSATESSFTIYKFDAGKYQAKECFTRVYEKKGKKYKTITRTCEEGD